jgi:hypothetical protein
MPLPASVIAGARDRFDLTDAADQDHLYDLTATLEQYPFADVSAAVRGDSPLALKLAHKLVDSRRVLRAIDRPVHIGVVFAMWGEHNRLRPKTAANPNGEDALRVKLAQLDWATRGTAVSWTLYAVDDGDPHGSGRLAQEIAAAHPLGDRVQVRFLADALPTGDGPLQPLASADDSRKGGAIIYGAMCAIDDGVDAVLYTDADNSVHLGQLGLLLRPWLDDGCRVVLGNRKHPQAVLVKQEGRWGIGIKLLRHMQRMIGGAIFARGIRDTQAAFKLYEARLLADIIAQPSVFDFSFDTDWILACIARDEPFVTVPFAFIDSAAESASIAQGPMTTWETLLKGLLTAVRRRGVAHNEEMGRVLDSEINSYRDLDLLINHLPPQLAGAADESLGDPRIMSPAEVATWIQLRKSEAV